MVEPTDGVPHGRDDLRMAMPEDRAHLTRGEIEQAPTSGIIQERALGTHRHEIHEIAAVAQ